MTYRNELGAAVATRVLANSFHYHPSLGLHLFHGRAVLAKGILQVILQFTAVV